MNVSQQIRILVSAFLLQCPALAAQTHAGIYSPDLEVTPQSFEIEVLAGTVHTDILAIHNPDEEIAAYRIECNVEGEIQWLSVDNGEGQIPPGETVRLTVTFDASELVIGDYQGTIVVRGEGEFAVEIPVNLTIIEPEWRAELDFRGVVVERDDWRPLEIANWRDEELTISGAESDNEEFWIEDFDEPRVVPPGRSAHFRVFCNASEEGETSATVTFDTDHPEHEEYRLQCSAFAVVLGGAGSITLENNEEYEISFWVEIEQLEEPIRYETGDVLAEFVPPSGGVNHCNPGIAWDWDNNWMWITELDEPYRVVAVEPDYNYEEFEVVAQFDAPGGCLGAAWIEGVLYIASADDSLLFRFDAEGHNLGDMNLNFQPAALTGDHEEELLFVMDDAGDNDIRVMAEGQVIGFISNYHDFIDSLESRSICWVPGHLDGQLWMNSPGHLWELFVDTDEWQVIGVVQGMATFSTKALDGIGHDGRNLWLSSFEEPQIQIVDDGITEIFWIMVEPMEGLIGPGGDVDIIIQVNAVGLFTGIYAAELTIWRDDWDESWFRWVAAIEIEEDPPRIWVEPLSLDFNFGYDEELQPNEERAAILTIVNWGTGCLYVDRIDFNRDEFYLDYFDGLFVLSGDSIDLSICFNGPENGVYPGVMTIHSNSSIQEELQVPLRAVVGPCSVTENEHLPLKFGITRVNPNPFNSTTTLSYNLPHSAPVWLAVYDLAGRTVAELPHAAQSEGRHRVVIDASTWPSGIYLVKLESLGKVRTAKVVLVR